MSDLRLNPRETGRKAVVASVSPDVWKRSVGFSEELKSTIAKHRLSAHPLEGALGSAALNQELTKLIHLEFAHAFAQIFTDALIQAMATSAQLEPRLGPLGKVSARFLLQLNLLDELGFSPNTEVTGDYYGSPQYAHYLQFAETLRQLDADPSAILTFDASPAARASRRTFLDTYNDHVTLTCVLACAESVFKRFAGPWAQSVARSTQIDTSSGYHSIHVEDESGHFIDDGHAEDSWYIFNQAITEERFAEVRAKVGQWLDAWAGFADNVLHIARASARVQ